ncbi:hypothetical protein FN846DRAFT_944872 [Sphaerosporella brunnea]|uniref:Uncharacterized protein n=1 Tax=Sphaerosporella brunnea TaxID=1250544 RepID=A0A5J5EZA6_9PEZI|nr:hypothetical protein FN846DRAFT_944872 [Sphaerosporella brunnea]
MRPLLQGLQHISLLLLSPSTNHHAPSFSGQPIVSRFFDGVEIGSRVSTYASTDGGITFSVRVEIAAGRHAGLQTY